MRLFRLTLLVSLCAVIALPGFTTLAADPPPAGIASDIERSLFNAQMALSSDPALAGTEFTSAQSEYGGAFAETIKKVAPDAHTRIEDGFDVANRALANDDAPAFAVARAEIRTAILAGGYAAVEDALARGNGAAALEWLTVREFRVVTRFSLPNSEGTRAVDGLIKGTTTQQDAILAVRADLFDTYQANLVRSLGDLAEAGSNGFTTRSSELAAQSRGYFLILAPAYEEQRGKEALDIALREFDTLQAVALVGGNLEGPLQRVDGVLSNFRAAPLSPQDRVRRAGQMMRYLSLVPVEYARGVEDGQIMTAFEIQEAVTFHEGAYAAFTDLESLLDTQDHAKTAEAKALFNQLTDQLESANIGMHIAHEDDIQKQTSALTALLKEIVPAEWASGNRSAGDFDVVESILDQMEAAVISGDYAAAESARLEAYAVMETGPEARLMAFAPELKARLEELFWNGQGENRGLAFLIRNQAPLKDIRASRAALDTALEEAEVTLGASSAPLAVATNAGMILFREGLEAILILASLMSSMKREHERKYRKPMIVGSVAAVVATILTWVAAHDVLMSFVRYGETLEAVVSLVAIVILLIIMNWFFHKMYWTDWIASFHARKKQLISGEAGLWLGLAALGFTSIYREGFETVLFLQALVLDSGLQVVLSGVGVGLLAVALVGIATFRLQVNLPYKKMLIVTGILIGGVLLQMVGKTVHVMQIVGWLPITLVDGLPIPLWVGTWFGVYATWQGLIAQVAAVLFVVGSYYLAEAWQKRHDSKPVSAAPEQHGLHQHGK